MPIFGKFDHCVQDSPDYLSLDPDMKILGAIGKFHLSDHVNSCFSKSVLITPSTIPPGMTGFRQNKTGIRQNANQFHRNATGIRWNRYKLPYLGTPLVNNII